MNLPSPDLLRPMHAYDRSVGPIHRHDNPCSKRLAPPSRRACRPLDVATCAEDVPILETWTAVTFSREVAADIRIGVAHVQDPTAAAAVWTGGPRRGEDLDELLCIDKPVTFAVHGSPASSAAGAATTTTSTSRPTRKKARRRSTGPCSTTSAAISARSTGAHTFRGRPIA